MKETEVEKEQTHGHSFKEKRPSAQLKSVSSSNMIPPGLERIQKPGCQLLIGWLVNCEACFCPVQTHTYSTIHSHPTAMKLKAKYVQYLSIFIFTYLVSHQ